MSESPAAKLDLRRILEDHFYLPVTSERLHLLKSAFLLLLSFDIWLELAGHAARYGAGNFNLSHFVWLDAIQPMPSPGLYLGVTFGAGLLAFVGAWLPQPRWVRAVLCAGYTYGWAMSLHDSYQHHYLISLVLFCFVFFPQPSLQETNNPGEVDADSAEPDGAVQTWAYPMLTTSIAIVYFYAAFAKLDAAWQSGDAFVRVAPEHARSFFELGAGYGLEQKTVLSTIGTSVVGIQLVLGSVYLVAPWFDREVSAERVRKWVIGSIIGCLAVLCLLTLGPIRNSAFGEFLPELAFVFVAAGLAGAMLRWQWTRWLALFAALSFHFGAEELGLKIGWFSYYMIMAALICLGPPVLSRSVVRFARDLGLTISELGFKERGFIAVILVLCVVGTVALAKQIDLPGVAAGFACAAVLLCADPVRRLVQNAQDAQDAALTAGALIAAAALMWFSVTTSEVRFDYYRYLGGDLRRRGDLEGALDAYIRANNYAPEGKSRREKEVQLRKALGR